MYKNKLDLGEKVYKILERGKVLEVVLPKDMQNALNLYRRNVEQLDEKEMNVDEEENNKQMEKVIKNEMSEDEDMNENVKENNKQM